MKFTRRGSVLTFAGATYIPSLLGFVTGPLLARALAPSGRGQVAAVTVFGLALPAVLSLGFPWAIGQRAALEPAMRASLFGAAIRFSCLTIPVAVAVGFAIVTWPLGAIHGGSRFVALITFAAAPITVLVYALQRLLIAEGALGAMAILQGLTLIANAVMTIVLFVFGSLTVTTYLLGSLGILVANAIATCLLVQDRPRGSYPLRPLLGFGLRAFVGTLAGIANARLDQLVMVPFVGSAQLGLYAVSVSVSSVPLSIGGAIGGRSYGEIAGSADRSSEAARYIRLSLLVGALTCLAVAAIAPLVPVLYGSRFRGSVVPLLALLPGVVALTSVATTSGALVIFDRPGVSSIAEVAGIVITVGGLLLLLGPMGILGAALVSSVSYIVTVLVHIYYLRRTGVNGMVPGRADLRWILGRLGSALRGARHLPSAS